MIPDIHNKPLESLDGEIHKGNKPVLFQSFGIDGSAILEDAALEIEIEEAICEREIITLRNQLKNISKQTGITSGNELPMGAEAYFGLSEEIFSSVNLTIDSEEIEVGNYLQKLHIKNHAVASQEVVHDLFTIAEEKKELDSDLMSVEDEILFSDICEAVTEKEIVDLRANLQSIAQSVSVHEHTFEEIEDLVNGELDEEIEIIIREEAMINAALSSEIALHREINSAVEEQDIMKLRASLKGIIENESSHSWSVSELDGYLNDELDGNTLALLEDELMTNAGLASDLVFHKEVDKAVAETDIMQLRERLKQISNDEQERTSEKLGVVYPKRTKLYWYAVASSIVLMVAFTSLLRHRTYTNQQVYASYYQPYSKGVNISRSEMATVNVLGTALQEMEKGDYSVALNLLESPLVAEQDVTSAKFYSGVVYQELGDYNKAISSFAEVVKHGDNLLVEQSEWYIGLCYLRIEERQKAIAQFRSIVSGKGFYREQSRLLLKQLE